MARMRFMCKIQVVTAVSVMLSIALLALVYTCSRDFAQAMYVMNWRFRKGHTALTQDFL